MNETYRLYTIMCYLMSMGFMVLGLSEVMLGIPFELTITLGVLFIILGNQFKIMRNTNDE